MVKLSFRIVLATYLLLLCNRAIAQTKTKTEQTGKVTQAITVGKPVGKVQQEDLGLVTFATGLPNSLVAFCSGILLANDWAITAGHCLDVVEGKTTTVTAAFTTGSFIADAVYKFGAGSQDPSGPDIGLVHLRAPITVHGTIVGFSTRLWSGDVKQKTVAVFGRGPAGTYGAADFTASSVQGRNIVYNVGPGTATTDPGDSGGPGIIWDSNVPYLVGVTSSLPGGGTSFLQASIPVHRNWILAVPKSQWFPNRSSNSFDVELDEINGTLWTFAPFGNQLAGVPWAAAQRAATALCMNRAMAGGHFEGRQTGFRFAVQCSNRTQVQWQDVSQAQVNGTGWGFTDINAVQWARANRAAERLCAGANQGFAGGHFTGHSAGTNFGLFCFGAGAQWFDSSAQSREAAGATIGDLDQVSWVDASHAAKAFCSKMGFDSGFFNGQQVGDKKGIVCQR